MDRLAARPEGWVVDRLGDTGSGGGLGDGRRRGARLEHDVLFFGSDEQLVMATAPFLREGLAQGHAAVAITTPGKLGLLRDGLGADAARVRFLEAGRWYVRPAAVIAEYDAVVRGLVEGGAPRVRVVGELPFGSTPGEHASWTRYEAIVNQAFKRLPLWVLCLYDTRALSERLIEDARRTHPTVREAGRRRPSADYVDPAVLLRQIPEPGLPVVGRPSVQLGIEGDSTGWRRPVAAAIAAHDLPAGRAEEFLIAVSEVVANAMRHGHGRARLRLWPTDGGVVCEVHDDGPGVDDPFAGYLPPGGDDATPGMGLWIARQLSDALAIRSGPGGTTVRLAIGR
jgi:anti-sigma regulatory factor (Ser/Thr protein kinase)